MIALGLIAIAGAMLLVRAGWGGRTAVAALGWAVLAVAIVGLALTAGAWGVALGAVTGMIAALAILAREGWRSLVRAGRVPRAATVVACPCGGRDLARRITVFVLVVPVAFVAAQWLAFAAQALARRGGAGPADAIVLTLFLQPLLWGGLMAWQLTRSAPAGMIAPPAGAAVLGAMLWGLS